MKKYILKIVFTAFVVVGLFGVSYADVSEKPVAADNPAPAAKPLTPEEQAHQKKQQDMDDEAVLHATKIRGELDCVMDAIKKVSPQASEFFGTKYVGVTLLQFIAALTILIVTINGASYIIRFIFRRILGAVLKLSENNSIIHDIFSNMQTPVRMFACVLGIYFALVIIIIDGPTVILISRAVGILFWISVFWFILIMFDAFFFSIERKFKGKLSSTSNLFDFLRKVIKACLIIIAVLSILNACGVNVNTIIASLGIGGMALAFASQETIANFFGSVSIILDRPFLVGDWVKALRFEGTVENIGFRSTRIRTFDGTIASIPNATLAKESVENMSKMPRRKVVQTIGLMYSATAEQIEKLLPELRTTIASCEGIEKDTVNVEFLEFGSSSLDISIVYFTSKIDGASYRAGKRTVNLAVMRLVEKHGLYFAFPSTSVYVEKHPAHTK